MSATKIKAQPFDCMQYFYGAVQKPLIRCFVRFNGHMDENALKRAIDLSFSAVPLISCCFDEKLHCWRKRFFNSMDVLHIVEAKNETAETAWKALLSSIDFTLEPQLKIFLIQENDHDDLCVIINHMVSDGAGFKQFLYLFAQLYSKCAKDPGYCELPAPLDRRDFGQILQNLSVRDELAILHAKPGSEKQDPLLRLPFKGDPSHPFIEMLRLKDDFFIQLKSFAKINKASVNDMFLASYVRAARQITGCRTVTVPCPVDLRKYKIPSQTFGICNLTGSYSCRITVDAGDSFAATLNKVSRQMQKKKASMDCLKGPMLYHLLFRILPFRTMKKIFYNISPVPVTSYSNLGLLDHTKFRFAGLGVEDAFLSTAVKNPPYFQVSISTYKNCCTLASSMYGTEEDRNTVAYFLARMRNELENIYQ